MDDHRIRTECKNLVPHGSAKVNVVYTNDVHVVTETLYMYEGLLKGETHKFMGLDLEYTDDEDDDKRVAVVQLAMQKHVLVFQWSRYVKALVLAYTQNPNLELQMLALLNTTILTTPSHLD